MNPFLESFIRDARAIADQRGVEWEVPLDADGIAPKGKGWNLTQMAQASPPPVFWINDFGTDQRAVSILNSNPPPGPVRTLRAFLSADQVRSINEDFPSCTNLNFWFSVETGGFKRRNQVDQTETRVASEITKPDEKIHYPCK